MSTLISRATFLKGLAGATATAAAGKFLYDSKHLVDRIPCRRLGPSQELGHMLRDGKLAFDPVHFHDRNPAADPLHTPDRNPENECVTITGRGDARRRPLAGKSQVIIVGGGIAGLSAAWWLKKKGFDDFVLFEMEQHVGGNSSSGKNGISAYPWGAHYVPIANEESHYLRLLFEELGVIQRYETSGLPVYDELFLCHDPQERLFKDGSFQEGLVPRRGLQPEDQEQLARFFQLVQGLKSKVGSDGKPAFAIPLDLSSQDHEFLALDKISMADWLAANKFNSRPLLWYVNYCCRDDYGSTTDKVSAWAGLHYFAGRRGKAANAENNAVVTWPEGNGYLVNKLREKLKDQIRTGVMVSNIASLNDHIAVRHLSSSDHQQYESKCARLIFAAPRFLSKHVISNKSDSDKTDHSQIVYPPWMVANVSLRKPPESKGEAIAWDNVNYYSDSLGYVVATHQSISTRIGPTVITCYFPLSEGDPPLERSKLAKSANRDWAIKITGDLEKMHPGITQDILSIDLWPWGHGMVRPSVGFIWGDNRRRMKQNNGRIFFAHSDMSGMSNFEEAQYQGVEAANKLLESMA